MQVGSNVSLKQNRNIFLKFKKMTNTELTTHPVFEKIEQLLLRLNEKEVKEKLEVEKQFFFKSAAIYLKDRLSVSLPTLISISELTAIAGEFENALGQINNFIANDNIGHINNAVNNINSAMPYIRNLPIPYQKGDLNFATAVSTFQQTIQEKYSQAETSQKALENKIDEADKILKEKESAITILTDEIKLKEKEIKALSTSFQTQLDTAASEHIRQIAEDRTTFRGEIDADRLKIQSDTAQIITDLERKLGDANKLVNAIGNVGVTGNYQIIANEHKTSADNWRYIAIGFMIILSSLLIYSIWKIGDLAYDWHKAIIRIIASAILIYPATYAARESSKHRRLENSNRKSELELAAINPFIEILDENKKQLIKEKLVEKYFGNNNENFEGEKRENISVDILEKIVKLITAAVKK